MPGSDHVNSRGLRFAVNVKLNVSIHKNHLQCSYVPEVYKYNLVMVTPGQQAQWRNWEIFQMDVKKTV